MKFCILMGSPRIHGNTAELCKPLIKELEHKGHQVQYITLEDKNIAPCKGCYVCQNVENKYGCIQKDDMEDIVCELINADCIILATPIYTWYCTGKMKALLDRHYGLNKFYGTASGSLIAGKKIAILATHGYDRVYATTPFETGIKCFCEHSHLTYLGLYSVQDTDDLASFQTKEAIDGAIKFVDFLIQSFE